MQSTSCGTPLIGEDGWMDGWLSMISAQRCEHITDVEVKNLCTRAREILVEDAQHAARESHNMSAAPL